MSPTTSSATGIWTSCPLRMTVNFCSCSMRLCRPRNCFSLLQSLKAVTNTTQITESRIAAPSIQPASASPSSSAPAAKFPQAEKWGKIRWGGITYHYDYGCFQMGAEMCQNVASWLCLLSCDSLPCSSPSFLFFFFFLKVLRLCSSIAMTAIMTAKSSLFLAFLTQVGELRHS